MITTTEIEDAKWDLALKVLKGMTDKQLVKTAYIWGPPGIGKTWAAYETAPEHYAVTLTEETPMSELRGAYMIKDGEQVWGDGPAVMAMRKGTRLVLNEISHAGPDAQSFLFPILEGAGTCKITLPTGETVVAAPGFNVVGTDNCDYKDLPEAFQNRWNVKLHIDTYSPGGIMGLDPYWRELAKLSTMAMQDGRIVSLRDWYTMQAVHKEGFEMETTCKLVFGETDGEFVYNSINQRETLVKQRKEEERQAYIDKYGHPPVETPEPKEEVVSFDGEPPHTVEVTPREAHLDEIELERRDSAPSSTPVEAEERVLRPRDRSLSL